MAQEKERNEQTSVTADRAQYERAAGKNPSTQRADAAARQASASSSAAEGLYRAILRDVHISPRKARLVADLVRGRPVASALGILDHLTKRSAPLVKNLIKSAVANAEQRNAQLAVDRLCVRRIFVDEGRTMKRYRPRAYGRASPIRKRSCHITVLLGEPLEKVRSIS